MKIVAIHQPCYLPYLGYFHKMMVADTFVILDHVQFEKNSFINRNKIVQPDGREMWLTMPVLTKNKERQPIDNVQIAPFESWHKKHLKSIKLCYSNAPFWNEVAYGKAFCKLYELLYVFDYSSLLKNIDFSFGFVCGALDLDDNSEFSSNYSPPLQQTKSDLVLEICQREGANIYFSGALGKGYLDEKKFKKAGIKIVYQDYQHPVYKQYQLKDSSEFHSHLSITDLLLNHGPKSREIIMQNNVTKEDLRNGYHRKIH